MTSSVASNAYADAVEIVCSLTGTAAAARLQQWEALGPFILSRGSLESGVRLQFHPSVDVAPLVKLVLAEQSCCRFLSFALTVDERGIGLDIHAPPEAADIVHELAGMTSPS